MYMPPVNGYGNSFSNSSQHQQAQIQVRPFYNINYIATSDVENYAVRCMGGSNNRPNALSYFQRKLCFE